MNEAKKLYDSISNIDDRFIEEAQTEKIGKAPARRAWAALAACLCVACLGAVAAVHPWEAGVVPTPSVMVEYEPTPDFPAGSASPAATEEAPGGITFAFNDVDAAPVGTAAMISLSGKDFRAMSAEESLRYFGLDLSEDGGAPVPGFELTGGGCFGQGHGVYGTEERGVYYDVNSYVFTDGGRSVTLTLRTTFRYMLPSPDQVKNGPEKIGFTEINGREQALFRYEDGEGVDCVYTEFVRDGAVCSVTARGLDRDELATALTSLVPQKDAVSETNTASGTVTFVDSRREDYFDGVRHYYTESHDYITLDCGGTELTVWLPGEAGRFSVGDSVAVTYSGEPATAYNIWPGQIIRVE